VEGQRSGYHHLQKKGEVEKVEREARGEREPQNKGTISLERKSRRFQQKGEGGGKG